MSDISQELLAQLEQAYKSNSPVKILGGNSKAFYGPQIDADVVEVKPHTGIINYEPTELVITARAGTPLSEIQSALTSERQMLGFEPPAYGDQATLGGTIACNLSGPRRAYRGAARDYVLGSTIINGKAERMHFGGEVMKNVAGYDVSRLMCGAMGTLGLMLDVSLKVIPLPEVEVTLVQECDLNSALDSMHRLVLQSLPLSATCYDGEKLYLRLASNPSEINEAIRVIGGEQLENSEQFWQQLREQQLAFFKSDKPLWRLSLASNIEPLPLDGNTFYEWGGALRWLVSDAPADEIRALVSSAGGHATLFRQNNSAVEPFHALAPGVLRIHRELKQAFDPANILNPGRLYADI